MIDKALDLTERLIPTLDAATHMGAFNRTDTRATLERFQRHGILIVKDYGLIGGVIGCSPINRSHLIAFEGVFYAERGFRTLIEEFEAWGASQGARIVALSCFSPRIGKIYEQLGYARLETYYTKEIRL
ncbi:MAG: hypothetical protein COB36_11615 [Alphaproteobacteria bacterium]|nr:MAG: hypothetical protein COB36_11615 [Alphaproteobacteria bacterium]